MKRTAEEWRLVREGVEREGLSLRGAAEKHRISFGTIVYRARVEGWKLSARNGRPRELQRQLEAERTAAQVFESVERARSKVELLRQEKEAIKEVKIELESYGERMRVVGVRTKRLIAEMAERTLREVEEAKLSAKDRASVLRDLAAVGKLLHRWDRESPEEERERSRRGAINLELMRVPPELLSGD
jgi:hypothetical protein